jgi:hypothetical protein
MADECPNHGSLPAKQKRLAAKRLENALSSLCDGSTPSDDDVHKELLKAQIFGGIEGLGMDVAVISFADASRLSRHKLAYTYDWLLKRGQGEIVAQVIEDVRERLALL